MPVFLIWIVKTCIPLNGNKHFHGNMRHVSERAIFFILNTYCRLRPGG